MLSVTRLITMRLAYDDIGNGDCVLLIHGHPFDRTLWSPQLTALRDDFRVLAPDLRGFGQSPVTPHRVTMREYASDLIGLLDDLGIAQAAVVGLSMGGLVAMELATSWPERCWALGLVATTAEPVTPKESQTRRDRADATERDGMSVLVDYMQTGLYGPSCPPAIRARVDAMMSSAPAAGAAAALRGRAVGAGEPPPQGPRHRPRRAAAAPAAGLPAAAGSSRHSRVRLRWLGGSLVHPGGHRRDRVLSATARADGLRRRRAPA
jgi:pimeloyl-ACP methyl ester carboxylesterase